MGISRITLEESVKHLPQDIIPNTPIIFNGVKEEKYNNIAGKSDLRSEFSIKDDELFIVNIGRLCPQKAQEHLLGSICALNTKLKNSDLPKLKFVVVGKGEDEDKLKNLVSELGIEDLVIFAGFRDDIPRFLNQADFMVHTAVYEGCPWVIIEAMISSLPVIAMDISSLPEFVVDGKTGYLAKSGDFDDIAEKIIKMVKNKDRKEMGIRGGEIALEKYTHQKMVDEIEKTFLLS